ncbi:hypothetical protein D9M73_241360 [compost metagenome]
MASSIPGDGSGKAISSSPSISQIGASTPTTQIMMRMKCPVVMLALSRIACTTGRPRSTSRYSANTRLIMIHTPGKMNSARPAMISSELIRISKASCGHSCRARANRSRLAISWPLLRVSRYRISAALYSG